MSNNKYKTINKMISFILCIVIIITLSFPSYAVDNLNSETTQSETKEQVTPLVEDDTYRYFDLYYGKVTISSNSSGVSYTGSVLKNGEVTEITYTDNSKKIYIYQSNGENTIWKNGLPKYDRVQAPTNSGKNSWGEYITNYTNISNIIADWDIQANAVNRKSTQYYIEVTGAGDHDVTIDNIWSSYHQANSARLSGGLSVYRNTNVASKFTLRAKGDNRFGNIFYATGNYKNHKMIFAGDENSTITVANLSKSSNTNHYNSAIGGSDSAGLDSIGISFESGIIFAGTTTADNCTAIGGGGNATGGVTINGGTITAVTNSTGTAIGGGIGWTSYGGDADVTINGGTVYAYNLGYSSIPAAAIGGGSSRSSNGNTSTTVTITGGTIFAQSTGGVAIGGGGSQLKNGGAATIDISGGTITAQSIANPTQNIQAGSGIGGGTGVEGGDANLSISGDAIVKTGSIGGGKTNTDGGKIGSATIDISGNPTIQGQFIMESASDDNPCSFTMNGGIIDNSTKTDDFAFLQENGGAIHIVNGQVTMNGGTIKNCSGVNGGAVYVTGGDFIMTSGSIINNTATNEGGAIYLEDGNIEIGLDGCIDDTHSHPVIKENIAENNGGALSVSGGKVSMYCGNITSNLAKQNQSGNSINQTGGVFDVWGGNIGLGIYVSNDAIFRDWREGIYQVTYHAIYEGVHEIMVAHVNSNEMLQLPKENELQNESFTREGLYLIGWSTSSTSEEGYMVVGSEIYVPQDTDLYAVWGTEEPIASYTVYIPDTLEISEKEKKGTMSIGATLKYFTNIASLSVSLQEKGELVHENASLSYILKDSNNNQIENEDIVAYFTSTNQSEKNITAEVSGGKPTYAGEYTDTLTFKVTYNDGSQ